MVTVLYKVLDHLVSFRVSCLLVISVGHRLLVSYERSIMIKVGSVSRRAVGL